MAKFLKSNEAKDSMNDNWMKCKGEIDTLVARLKNDIFSCDPLLLLTFCAKKAAEHFRIQFQGRVEAESPRLMAEMRAAEYVQSVLVSLEQNNPEPVAISDEKFDQVIGSLEQVFWYSMRALLYADKFITQSSTQMASGKSETWRTAICMYITRGKRHIAYSKGYLALLLRTHEGILNELYGITVAQVADGFEKLIWQLMLGDHEDPEHFLPSAYEVEPITGWPEAFVEDLSLPIYGSQNFLSGDFAGWLFRDSPIKERPFIKIGQKHYAFSYHIVSDYFYRAVQFAVTGRGCALGVKYTWHAGQCKATEGCCAEAMAIILPGGEVLSENFYKDSNGKWVENDLMVKYCDVVIVVEVKAAALSHASPIDAMDEIAERYEHIKKAILQCNRTESFLRMSTSATKFCDHGYHPKAQVEIPKNCKIFKMVVTADNVSEIASCSGSLSGFVGNCQGVVCLSIDDLMVYVNNFKGNPLLFLYYLKVRTKATYIDRMMTYDEMDHLDSFSGNPNYVDVVGNVIGKDMVTFANVGGGCTLDTTKVVLPQIPLEYDQILHILAIDKNTHAFALTDFLLSMSLEEQNHLARNIAKGIDLSCKLGHAVSFRSAAGIPVGLFVTIGSTRASIEEFSSAAFRVARNEVASGTCEKFFMISIECQCGKMKQVDCEILDHGKLL